MREKEKRVEKEVKRERNQEEDKLDLIDSKILYELDLNCRQSNAQIAKKLRISKDVVNYRIKKLKDDKIIQSYYTIIDLTRLGYLSFRIYLRFSEIDNEKEKEIIDSLVKNSRVGWVAKREGIVYDLACLVWAKDIFDFKEFIDKLLNEFGEVIEKQTISLWTKIYHYNLASLLGKKTLKKEWVTGSVEKVDVDELDLKILYEISSNARGPLIDIAEHLKVSEKVIAYRMREMEKKKIILGYRALLDTDKIGYNYYKIDILLKDKKLVTQLKNLYKEDERVIYINETVIGTSDFEFDVYLQNRTEIFQIIKELRERFSKGIRNISYETNLSFYKLVFFPGSKN